MSGYAVLLYRVVSGDHDRAVIVYKISIENFYLGIISELRKLIRLNLEILSGIIYNQKHAVLGDFTCLCKIDSLNVKTALGQKVVKRCRLYVLCPVGILRIVISFAVAGNEIRRRTIDSRYGHNVRCHLKLTVVRGELLAAAVPEVYGLLDSVFITVGNYNISLFDFRERSSLIFRNGGGVIDHVNRFYRKIIKLFLHLERHKVYHSGDIGGDKLIRVGAEGNLNLSLIVVKLVYEGTLTLHRVRKSVKSLGSQVNVKSSLNTRVHKHEIQGKEKHRGGGGNKSKKLRSLAFTFYY